MRAIRSMRSILIGFGLMNVLEVFWTEECLEKLWTQEWFGMVLDLGVFLEGFWTQEC